MFESIPLDEFVGRTGAQPRFASTAQKIVSLRDIRPGTITTVQVMPRRYLESMIRSITLEGDENRRPYANCEIKLARKDPYELEIGQTFVERMKYQSLLETFEVLFDEDFCVTRGVAKCNALIIFGKTQDGEDAIAHYIPPIIESSNNVQFLLDGIHRNFLVMRIGTTIESIVLKGVDTPLPCETRNWSTIRVVDEKPLKHERFYDLKPELFRNLKRSGIDG
ncbi:MAG: hypothetical protein AAB617_01215 [Patescibacteria group bacterium]